MRLLHVGLGAAALMDGACSTDSFNGDAGADAMTDAIADVSAEAGSDGGASGDATPCPGTWCDCVPKMPSFCDDFDKDAEYAGVLWDDKTGYIKDDGGIIALDTVMPESPPKYMYAHVPAETVGRVEVAVTEDIGPPTSKSVLIAFDLLVSGASGNCLSGSPEIVRLGADNSYLRNPQLTVAFGMNNGHATLFFQTGVSNPMFTLTDFAIGAWFRVRLRVDAYVTDAGATTVHAAVGYANAGTPEGTGAVDAGIGAVTAFIPTPTKAWVSMGSMDDSINSTADCAIHIDNVAFYQ